MEEWEKSGECRLDSKTIGINYGSVEKEAKGMEIPPELYVLLVLIHEEVHAVTAHECNGSIQQVGYQKDGGFRFWNEGVTELFAQELFRRYALKKKLASEEKIDEILTRVRTAEHYFYRTEKYWNPYGDEVILVSSFIERVAREVGVSQDIVREAVIYGMFCGENLGDNELVGLAKNILPPGFLSDMENPGDHMNVRILARELRRKNNFLLPKNSKFIRGIIKHIERIREQEEYGKTVEKRMKNRSTKDAK